MPNSVKDTFLRVIPGYIGIMGHVGEELNGNYQLFSEINDGKRPSLRLDLPNSPKDVIKRWLPLFGQELTVLSRLFPFPTGL